MKIDKVVPKNPDVQLTLTAEEARALFWIVKDFDPEEERPEFKVGAERFDVTLHNAMLKAGLNGRGMVFDE